MSIATGIAQAAYQNSDGRLQLVWVNGHQCRTKWEIDALGNYSSEADIHTGYQLLDTMPLSMSLNKQGRLVVFAYSTFGIRVACSQTVANGAWGTFAPFP